MHQNTILKSDVIWFHKWVPGVEAISFLFTLAVKYPPPRRCTGRALRFNPEDISPSFLSRSESMSQVFFLVIEWLVKILQSFHYDRKQFLLAYDNMYINFNGLRTIVLLQYVVV